MPWRLIPCILPGEYGTSLRPAHTKPSTSRVEGQPTAHGKATDDLRR